MKITTVWKCKSCGLGGEIQHPAVLDAREMIQKVRDTHFAAVLKNGKICRWNDNMITIRRHTIIPNPPEPQP